MGRRRRRGAHLWTPARRRKRPLPASSPDAATAAAPAALQEAPAPLPPGAEVEVRVDDDGFHGSWFEATVVDFSPARGTRWPARYRVTYSHLLADDGGVLTEHFAVSHIRPRPPPPPTRPPTLRLHDIVEAFHNDGWWSGIVAVAPADPADTVTVAFPITREVISFAPRFVRPRRDYVDGEWVPSRAVIAVQPKRAVREYEVGDKVEVGRDREVFGRSWFPATVAKVVDPLSYIVKYFDQEEDGNAGTEKATEYLHWRFIRPAVEHMPLVSEFQLGPGAAVEAYYDGAWSPGIVRRAVGEGEYEVSINGNKGEVLVNRVVELLKPLYKWNGKTWKIVSAKRKVNLRQRSGTSPSSPVDIASSEDEHDHGSSAAKKTKCPTKRLRKEPQQQEHVLTEGAGNVLVAPADCHASSTLDKKVNLRRRSMSERCPSAPFDVAFSWDDKNHDCRSSATKMLTSRKGPRKEPQQDLIIAEGFVDVSISDMDIPLSTLCKSPERDPAPCAAARINSAGQQTSKKLLSVKAPEMKKDMYNSEETHSIQELQGKHDASNNSQLTEDGNSCPKEIICALTASVDRQTKQAVSGRNTKVTIYRKMPAKKKRSKELSSPYNLFGVDSTFQHRGRENSMGRIKSCTQQDLDKPTEDACQEHSPLIPPGFESLHNAGGICRHGSLLDEELTNGISQANRNESVSTDVAGIQGAKSSQLMSTAMLSLDHPTQQGAENHQNAGSSSSIVDNSKLRRCSVLSHLTSPISGHMAVPFVKTSPLWHALEESDAFKLLPQQPHFLNLKDHPLEMREGLAIGLMVMFINLVQSIKDANIDESMEFFESKCDTVRHLEINGFHVQFLRNKLTKMLEVKSEFSKNVEEINKLKTGIVEKENYLSCTNALLHEKHEAIGELERQLAHLREETKQILKNREGVNAELLRLQSKVGGYEEACADEKIQFQSLLGGCLHQKRLS